MNEVVAALPVVGSIVWILRPRPPARRPPPIAPAGSPGPPTSPRRARRRRRRDRDADPVALAHWCESVARRVSGGDALRTAIGCSPEDGTAAASVDLIRRRVAGPLQHGPLPPDAALVAAVVSACLEHGGASAEPLDRAAGVLRARAAERDERRVQSAQARLSALVLTWLPVAVLALLVSTSAAVRHVVATPSGLAFVVAGSVLNLAGWWWMRRIVDRAAR